MAGAVRVTIVVENTVADDALRAEHGFAVWIETGAGRVLFDTGQGRALAPNAEHLGIDLSTADAIGLSHGHYDHTGGMTTALRAAPGATVYAHPAALEPKYAVLAALAPREIGISSPSSRMLAEHTGRFVESKGPTEVLPGLHLTGEVPRTTDFEDTGGPFFLNEKGTAPDLMLDDQALYFVSTDGVVLILGCAHAGVINTMRYVAELTGGVPFACVFGGMHLVGASDERIESTIEALREFDVKRIGPAHCTGETAVARFRKAFPDRFFACPAGSRFEFPTGR